MFRCTHITFVHIGAWATYLGSIAKPQFAILSVYHQSYLWDDSAWHLWVTCQWKALIQTVLFRGLRLMPGNNTARTMGKWWEQINSALLAPYQGDMLSNSHNCSLHNRMRIIRPSCSRRTNTCLYDAFICWVIASPFKIYLLILQIISVPLCGAHYGNLMYAYKV